MVREKVRAQEDRQGSLALQQQTLGAKLKAIQTRRADQVHALEEAGQARAEIAAALAESEGSIAVRDSVVQDLFGREEELKVEIIEDMNRLAGARNGMQAVRMEREYLERDRAELAAKEESVRAEQAAAVRAPGERGTGRDGTARPGCRDHR